MKPLPTCRICGEVIPHGRRATSICEKCSYGGVELIAAEKAEWLRCAKALTECERQLAAVTAELEDNRKMQFGGKVFVPVEELNRTIELLKNDILPYFTEEDEDLRKEIARLEALKGGQHGV